METRVDEPLYGSVHARLKYSRGRASKHACEMCGGSADEWAYDHSDPEEVQDERGRPYSYDLTRYRPLCRSCHRKADGPGSVCRKGHERTEENTYVYRNSRYCKECRRQYLRQYRARRLQNG